MSSSGITNKSNRFNLLKKFKVMNKRKKLAIILVEIILLISIIPVMAADSTVQITINLVDQYGIDITAIDEKVYIDNYGWFEDGDILTVDTNEVIYYRAYFQQGSGLYGSKMAHVSSLSTILDITYVKLMVNLIDQEGNTIAPPIATENERVYIDHVGYHANGDTIIVPDNANLNYRGYYQTGSGLYGPKLSVSTADLLESLDVEFITFDAEFTPGLPYTGSERVYIDHAGYKENNEPITVPKDSTIHYRMYFKAGSGLYGSKHSLLIDSGNVDFDHNFKAISMNFVDQTGHDIVPALESGNECVYIDHVGYRYNSDTIAVPDDSVIHYRGYYQQGSGLYGPKLSMNVEYLVSACDVPCTIPDFWTCF